MMNSSSSSSRRGGGSWDDRQQQQQNNKRDIEDLALFQDMRIREDPTSDHLHGSTKFGAGFRGLPGRNRGSNDLLTSETDKNDYDWLLTPPGTPLFPSLDRDWLVGSPSQRDSSRWPSKLSRLSSDSQQQAAQFLVSSSSSGSSSGGGSRVTTSITTRGSNPSPRRQSAPASTYISATATTTTISRGKPVSSNSSSVANARPSTPTGSRRPSSAPTTTLSARRPSTPTPTPSSGTFNTNSSRSSRPSTPTRSSSSLSSRPSTPTRRVASTPSPTPAPTSSSGTFPTISNGRTSRGTSPVRRPQQNERSSSNSRAATISKTPGADAPAAVTSLLTRSYNHLALDREMSSFSRRAAVSANDGVSLSKSEPLRKPVKSCGTSRETSFYGTSISKKSLDTAIRHMDIRRSSPGGFRTPPAVASYPKSTAIVRTQIQQEQQQYNRLLPAEQQHLLQEERLNKGLFELDGARDRANLFPVQDSTDSFLLEFSESRFLEEADPYLKDP